MIKITVRTQFDKQKLKKKAETATFTSLREAGGAIRKTAKRSIRKRKKPSSPGSPPHTQTGMLRRVIRYDISNNRTVVAIGPVNEIAGQIWNLHEFGGVATKRRKLKPHRFKVGSTVPSAPYSVEAKRSLPGSNCGLRLRRIELLAWLKKRTSGVVTINLVIIQSDHS